MNTFFAMEKRKILLGSLVMALVFAFSAAPVLACDGGGGEVLFNGNVVVGTFYLTDGFTTVSYNGLVNVDKPYVNPSQINSATDTIYVNQLRMRVQTISSYQGTKYMDISGAELTVTGAASYSCDLQFGDVARVNVVTAQSCTAFAVPVCNMLLPVVAADAE